MDKNRAYAAQSLELHLFFARIMKEHAFFLKVGFMQPNANFAKESEHLMRQFETLLSRAITMSDRAVRSCVLHSGEVFTEFTDCAERQTQQFTGTFINRELTARAMRLNERDCDDDACVSQVMMRQIRQMNRDAIALVDHLIDLKERILHCIASCELFTANYPLLIEHILREARLYRAYLAELEGMDDCDCKEMRDSEMFWNRIMMEHALFIRGLLDPCETELIHTADDFSVRYRNLLDASASANDRMMRNACERCGEKEMHEEKRSQSRNLMCDERGMCNVRCMCSTKDAPKEETEETCTESALSLTRAFRDFKHAGTNGIGDCEIRSIILPLLADHVLREANHYLRLLESEEMKRD